MGRTIDNLRGEIKNLRHVSTDGKHFVCQHDINALFTKTVIAEAIRECVQEHAVPSYHENIVANRIFTEGKIVFGILIWKKWQHKLMSVIEHNALDSQLPLEITQADEIMENVGWDFAQNAQWEFLPRTLTKEMSGYHTHFRNEEILPFIGETRLAGRGFDEVFRVSVLPSLQTIFPEQTAEVFVVRKTLRRNLFSEREKESLQILDHLKHPNIVKLLASYTHFEKQHFLFSLLPMDLECFLRLGERFGEFKNDFMFYTALQGLSSALEAIHDINLNTRVHGIEFTGVGYHHNIEPTNILVSSRTFILADFGLARFHHADKNPQARWKYGLKDYVAPECMGEKMIHKDVGRPLDIWSFGCLVSEVAAYIEGGPNGVGSFRKQRSGAAFRPNIEDRYFFSGNNVRPQVVSWFEHLKARSATQALRCLLDAASLMLRINPTERPKAAEIHQRLSFLSVKSLFDAVQQSLTSSLGVMPANNCVGSPSKMVESDNVHLTAWGTVLQLAVDDPSADAIKTVSGKSDFYRHILTTLLEILDAEAEAVKTASSLVTMRTPEPFLEKCHELIQVLRNSLPQDKLREFLLLLESFRSDASSSTYSDSLIADDASSQTSVQSIVEVAWFNIQLLFVEREDLRTTFERALEKKAAEKITRKLSSLLNHYCLALQESASSSDERHAIKIIKRRRKELANEIGNAALKLADVTTRLHMDMLQDQSVQKSQQLERYLSDQRVHRDTSIVIPEQTGEEQDQEEQTIDEQAGEGDDHTSGGSDTDSVQSENIDSSAQPNLDHLKTFLTCGSAFAILNEEFEKFAEGRVSSRHKEYHKPPERPQPVDHIASDTAPMAGDGKLPNEAQTGQVQPVDLADVQIALMAGQFRNEPQSEPQPVGLAASNTAYTAEKARFSSEAKPKQPQLLDSAATDTVHMLEDAEFPNDAQASRELPQSLYLAAVDTEHGAGDAKFPGEPKLKAQPVSLAAGNTEHMEGDAQFPSEAQPEAQPVGRAADNTAHMEGDAQFLSKPQPELQPANLAASDTEYTAEQTTLSNPLPSLSSEQQPLLGGCGITLQYSGVSSLESFDDQHDWRLDSSQPRLTTSDHIKAIIEKYVGMPILWWPLKQPNRVIPENCTRISWDLDCSHIASIDIPTPLARTLQSQSPDCTATDLALGVTQRSTGGATSQSFNASLNLSQISTPVQLTGIISNTNQPPSNQQNSTAGNAPGASAPQLGLNTGSSSEKYIHWCVDSASRDTKLHHVCVESPVLATFGGNRFIEELNTSYKRLRGWRWIFSFQICIKAKIVRFVRPIGDDDDLVGCLDDEVTFSELSKDLNYDFKIMKPDELHLTRVEITLAHQLQCGMHCKPAAIEKLISHLPKKATGKLEPNTAYGYGIHAQQGIALYKILMAHALTQAPLWGFAVYWLIQHHGDLQNALQPALYMLALVTAVIGVADYYDK